MTNYKSAGVWVKASERLPEGKNELVCMRGDGGGCYHYETADKSMIEQRMQDDIGVHHKFDPEWLDSSSPCQPSPDKPIGSFDVIKYLSDTGNEALRLSPFSNVVATDKKGHKCTITIGVDEQTFNDISFNLSKCVGGLLIIRSEEFDKAKSVLSDHYKNKQQ